MSTILYVILALLLLGIMVTVHELGHFTAARACGIAVRAFGVGFGPKIFSRKSKKSGTEYSLRAIPGGGFCAFYGEDDITGEQEKTDPRSFTIQPAWKRLIVMAAGPIMNFVLAFAAGYQELVDYIHILARKHTLYVPDVPVIGGGLFTYDYCMEHLQELNAVYRSLADDESRRVFLNVIQYKISGCIHYLDAVTAKPEDIYRGILHPSRSEHFVDLGAYNGDTIRELLEYTHHSYSTIHAVEPDRKNFKKLVNFIETADMKRINAYHCAAWCKDTELPFSSKSGRQSVLSPTGETLPARSVDSLLAGAPASFIKMDVEGFEREAIWGAANTIRHYAPKMAIAVYHRNEDIFELPLLVHHLNPKYKLYLRHRLYIPAWETNLYAIPE